MPDSPSAWLRSLAAEATPGPWATGTTWSTILGQRKQEVIAPDGADLGNSWFSPEDARLIALAPDLAVLCADAIDAMEHDYDLLPSHDWAHSDPCKKCELLARFAALQPDNTEEGT